jgi:uncharacterized protein YbbK (DUF523 family)
MPKIKIAVSSCLLGEAVRYDGTDKLIISIAELGTEYNLISICPEMAIGMGVPRPPIHLVDTDIGIQVLAVDDANKNMTKPLSNFAKKIFEEHKDLCGYIFKKNSPSCGTKKVKVLNNNCEYERRGIGIYAYGIIKELPSLPIIDEEGFLDKAVIEIFLHDVTMYAEKLKN